MFTAAIFRSGSSCRVLTKCSNINEIQNFGLSYFVTSVNGIGYTILILARSLIIMPVRFIGVPIAQAALPFLADLSQPSNISLFKKTLLQSLNQIVYLACPAAVLLLILRLPVVRLVFGTRNFPWELSPPMYSPLGFTSL